MRSLTLVVAFAMGACGPSAIEVRTAKTAVYKADPMQLLKVAGEATELAHYKIAAVDANAVTFSTRPTFYGPEGDLQSGGAEGWVHTDDRSVRVSFMVKVVVTDDQQMMVTVTPKTFQYIKGSPEPRELAPADPNLPTFVSGRADSLAMAIYTYAKPYLAK